MEIFCMFLQYIFYMCENKVNSILHLLRNTIFTWNFIMVKEFQKSYPLFLSFFQLKGIFNLINQHWPDTLIC